MSKKVAIIGLCRTRGPAPKGVRPYPQRGWSGGLNALVQRNLLISKHIKSKHQIENIIFEDIPFSKGSKKKIIGRSIPTKFVNIWDDPTNRLLGSYKRGSKLGYKGMCQFYAMEFMHYLKGYDYCIRLDDDSFLHSELNIDPFIKNKLIYGYVRDKEDNHADTRRTLPPAIKEYIKSNDVKILCNKENGISMWHHYSNFWLTDLSFWNQHTVKNYLNHIHSLRGIQRFRWGDHVIMSNALRMFCPPRKITKLQFKYEHRSHGWKNY